LEEAVPAASGPGAAYNAGLRRAIRAEQQTLQQERLREMRLSLIIQLPNLPLQGSKEFPECDDYS
jgi:hypothetical protein